MVTSGGWRFGTPSDVPGTARALVSRVVRGRACVRESVRECSTESPARAVPSRTMEPDRTLGEVFDDVADHCEEAREGYSAEIVGRGQRDYFRLGSYAVSILSGLVRSPDLSPVVKVATAARGCGFVRGQVQAMRSFSHPGQTQRVLSRGRRAAASPREVVLRTPALKSGSRAAPLAISRSALSDRGTRRGCPRRG